MSILEKVGLAKRPLTDLELADIAEENGNPGLAQWLRDRHAKKTAQASAEPNHSDMSKWEARLVFGGISAAMASGTIINPEAVHALNEAHNLLGLSHREDGQKPPKPPRRPNIPIGGTALDNP